jgi:hypothetical protein
MAQPEQVDESALQLPQEIKDKYDRLFTGDRTSTVFEAFSAHRDSQPLPRIKVTHLKEEPFNPAVFRGFLDKYSQKYPLLAAAFLESLNENEFDLYAQYLISESEFKSWDESLDKNGPLISELDPHKGI